MVHTRRSISLAAESLLSDHELVIELSHQEYGPAALELTLLWEGLSETLRLRPIRGGDIVLEMIDDEYVSRAAVSTLPDGTLRFTLGKNQVGFLQRALLIAHRDGAAEVSHAHVEGEHADHSFDLTVMFELYAAPLSPDEVVRQLGRLHQR